MRKRIYNIIEPTHTGDKLSSAYDIFMIVVICLSLVPLLFSKQTPLLNVLDKVTVAIFIVDYFLRLITADYKYEDKRAVSFIRYPFSPMAIVDLLSILPSLTVLNSGFKTFRVLRLLKALKVVRFLKLFRYSESIRMFGAVFHKQKDALITVFGFAVGYVIVTAIIMFQVEPQIFDNFFDALYWSTISLTTVGYGDIYPLTTVGHLITMLSSIVGLAVIALPAGVITAGYIEERALRHQENDSNMGED